MAINIIAFGKLSLPFYREAASEYCKRIQHYTSLIVNELREDTSPTLELRTKRNTQQLLAKLAPFSAAQVIVLDFKGRLVSSEDISALVEQSDRPNNQQLVFVIGPSDGFDLKRLQQFRQISLGRVTLPHQLCRVVLLEQIYRGFKILHHETYHK